MTAASPPPTAARRQDWLAVLARADTAQLERAAAALQPWPAYRRLRAPQAGMVMLRARIGGSGAPFNCGEATVVRCALQFDDGRLGVGYALGRDRRKAELIALLDALLQEPARSQALLAQVIAPLRAGQMAARTAAARATAASRVEFFTLVRGET